MLYSSSVNLGRVRVFENGREKWFAFLQRIL